MADIALIWDDEQGCFDIAFDGTDLATDDGLHTAAVLSLFCNRRAAADDALPADQADRRGWWGDALLAQGDRIGSRRWLVWPGQKQLPETAARAQHYDSEALAWMRTDSIVGRLNVSAEWISLGVLGELITVELPRTGERIAWRYEHLWQGVRAGSGL